MGKMRSAHKTYLKRRCVKMPIQGQKRHTQKYKVRGGGYEMLRELYVGTVSDRPAQPVFRGNMLPAKTCARRKRP